MTREPEDFALKEQILSDYLAGWEPADRREAVEAIQLDATEEAAARQLTANTGQPVHVMDVSGDAEVKEQVLSDYLAGWSPADAREAVQAIRLDAAEAAAERQFAQFEPAPDPEAEPEPEL
jgi:hypothetical protein